MNIANYLIGELSNETAAKFDEAENMNIINNLVDSWSTRKYIQPKPSKRENERRVSFDHLTQF